MLPPLEAPELLLTSFDLFKPPLKRFPSEENTPTDPYTRQVWDAWNLVMDDVAEMRARTPHKRGSLGEVQDSRGHSSLEVDWRWHWINGGGGHTISPVSNSSGSGPRRTSANSG